MMNWESEIPAAILALLCLEGILVLRFACGPEIE